MFLVSARLIAARCCCCCCRGLHQDREQPTTRSARESRVKATSSGKSSISVRKVESEFLGRRSGTELNWKLVFLLSGDLVLGRSCCSELFLACLVCALFTNISRNWLFDCARGSLRRKTIHSKRKIPRRMGRPSIRRERQRRCTRRHCERGERFMSA